MKPNNPNIKLGKLWKEEMYMSWLKKWKVEEVEMNWDIFKKWVRVIFNDPDDNEEFIGNIDWIVFDARGSVQASIKDIAYWRVDVDILEVY